MAGLALPIGAKDYGHLVGGVFQDLGEECTPVVCPYTAQVMGSVSNADAAAVIRGVALAVDAWPTWQRLPVAERAVPLFHLRALLLRHQDDLANLISCETGRTFLETSLEVSHSVAALDRVLQTASFEVGTLRPIAPGLLNEEQRLPLGVTCGITPLCYPLMIPLQIACHAILAGNAFILKPSEFTPLTACRLGELMQLAGVLPGIFSILHGGQTTTELLLERSELRAIASVGTSETARAIYAAAARGGMRALCLGGAENHVVVLPDADGERTVGALVDAFTHSSGQSCLAANVLVCVGSAATLLPQIVEAANDLQFGSNVGPLVGADTRQGLIDYIDQTLQAGARLLLDGRTKVAPRQFPNGHWLGPTILQRVSPHAAYPVTELMGPILTVVSVDTFEEAIHYVQGANCSVSASIFTESGAAAREFAERLTTRSINVNQGTLDLGAALPFTGSDASKFGVGEIAGPNAVEFWSSPRQVVTRWRAAKAQGLRLSRPPAIK